MFSVFFPPEKHFSDYQKLFSGRFCQENDPKLDFFKIYIFWLSDTISSIWKSIFLGRKSWFFSILALKIAIFIRNPKKLLKRIGNVICFHMTPRNRKSTHRKAFKFLTGSFYWKLLWEDFVGNFCWKILRSIFI